MACGISTEALHRIVSAGSVRADTKRLAGLDLTITELDVTISGTTAAHCCDRATTAQRRAIFG